MMSTEPIPAPSLSEFIDSLSDQVHSSPLSYPPPMLAGFDMCRDAVREAIAAGVTA